MSKNKKYVMATIIILIILLAALFYLLIRHNDSISDLPTNVRATSYPSENSLNNQRKTSNNPSNTLNNGPSNTGNTTINNSPVSATLSITRAGVQNSNLQVGTLVSGATTGTCVLTLSQTGQTDIKSTNTLVLENNTYSCPVFNVPLTSFPNKGLWNVSITLYNNNTSTTSNWDNNPVNLSSDTP